MNKFNYNSTFDIREISTKSNQRNLIIYQNQDYFITHESRACHPKHKVDHMKVIPRIDQSKASLQTYVDQGGNHLKDRLIQSGPTQDFIN